MNLLRPIYQQANPDANGGGGGAPNPAAPNPAAANNAWYGDLGDKPQEFRDWAQNKGYQSPADALWGHWNTEKLIGLDKAGRTVVLPKDATDVEGTKAFHAKLGVPESADKYELPLPEGDDGSFAKVASTWFHQAGVPKSAAQGIAKAWNEHISALVKEGEAQEQAASKRAVDEVRAAWGPEATQKEEMARRAFAHVFGNDKMEGYEKSLGTAEFLKMAALVGEKFSEPGLAGGNGGGNSFAPSKAAAQTRLEEIRMQRAAGSINEQAWKGGVQAEFERLSQIVAS